MGQQLYLLRLFKARRLLRLDSTYGLLSSLTRPIFVVHLEGPSQLLLGRPTGRHVSGHHELLDTTVTTSALTPRAPHLEVYTAVPVLVEYSEDLIYEDFRIPRRENHGVHLQDLVLAQLPVRAVLLESSTMDGISYSSTCSTVTCTTP